jgi:protein-disulfide isomerase-like protein with CxxC motif
MTEARWKEISAEFDLTDPHFKNIQWFCSDWIKAIARDLFNEVLILKLERDTARARATALEADLLTADDELAALKALARDFYTAGRRAREALALHAEALKKLGVTE